MLQLPFFSSFTLGLNAVKNIDYIEICFKRNLSRIKFPTKNSVEAHLSAPTCFIVSAYRHECSLTLKLDVTERSKLVLIPL